MAIEDFYKYDEVGEDQVVKTIERFSRFEFQTRASIEILPQVLHIVEQLTPSNPLPPNVPERSMPTSQPTGKDLIELKNRVLKSFNESNWLELGAITEMIDQVNDHPRLLRSLSWGDGDYEGCIIEMLKSMVDSDPDNYPAMREYIFQKCPEEGENVSSIDNPERRIVFTPSVFDIPEESPDANLISVMMPFTSVLAPVYESIKLAAAATGFGCLRADDIWDHSTVIQDVFSLIFRSYIVVCDFSDRNPNVFYEAGIAHTLGKHVVPITQSKEDVPFDLRHHRYASYLNNSEGRDVLQKDLTKRFRELANKKHKANW